MTAYYNEHDGFKADWLRELIKAGHITSGEVDERDIKTVTANDLDGFTQYHFFAGIGVWSYALRLAGWPDDRPVWTGSCPCPGFSAAGKGGGFGDARHLWPDWFRLIKECKPTNIFGEQADDAVGFGWLDLVQTNLEAANYAVGKAVFGACSVGAPHIRQRLYFGAHANGAELCGQSPAGNESADRRDGKAIRGRAHAQCDGGRPNKQEREAQGRAANGTDCANDGHGHADQPLLEGLAGHGDGSDKSRRQSFRDRTDRLTSQARLTASGPTQSGCPAQTASIGQLNPAYSRWLMGLPQGWDACAVTAMPLWRSRRKHLSKRG